MEYEFCGKWDGKNFEEAAFSVIKELIKKPNSRKILKFLREVYKKQTSSEKFDAEKYYKIKKCDLNKDYKSIKGQMMGIDFPIWLWKRGMNKREKKGCIMILGQDPLRNSEYFKKRKVPNKKNASHKSQQACG